MSYSSKKKVNTYNYCQKVFSNNISRITFVQAALQKVLLFFNLKNIKFISTFLIVHFFHKEDCILQPFITSDKTLF